MSTDRSHLVEKRVVNKNGVETTVHVKPDDVVQLSGNLRLVGTPQTSNANSAHGGREELEIETIEAAIRSNRGLSGETLAQQGWRTEGAKLGMDNAEAIDKVTERFEGSENPDPYEVEEHLADSGVYWSNDEEDAQLLQDDESIEHYNPEDQGDGNSVAEDIDIAFDESTMKDPDSIFDRESDEPEPHYKGKAMNIQKFQDYLNETTGLEYGVKFEVTRLNGRGGAWPEANVTGSHHNLRRYLKAYENGKV